MFRISHFTVLAAILALCANLHAQENLESLRLEEHESVEEVEDGGGVTGEVGATAQSGEVLEEDEDSFWDTVFGAAAVIVSAQAESGANCQGKCECEAEVTTAINASSAVPECLVSLGTLASVTPGEDPEGSAGGGGLASAVAIYEVQGGTSSSEGVLYATFDVLIIPNSMGTVTGFGGFSAEGGLASDPSWILGTFLGFGSGWHITGVLHHHNSASTNIDTYIGDSVDQIWSASQDVAEEDITYQEAALNLGSGAVNNGDYASGTQWEGGVASWYEIIGD